MNERENQQRLDKLAMKYLTAIDAGDFDTIDVLWMQAEHDADLGEMLHELNAEVAASQETDDQTRIDTEVIAAIDGDIGLTQCSVHVDECTRTTYCPTRPHWAAINRAVGQALAAVSLDAMITPAAFAPRTTIATTSPELDEPRYSA